MRAPKVSVVIPVYNGEKTLRQCLDSVLNQSYKDFEVIAVDNNSTDNTKKIIEESEKRDKKVRYVFEGYRSRGAARNAGIRAAKGEIIAMTDCDCVVPKNWLSRLIEPIIYGRADIVQGNELDIVGNYWTKMQQEFNQKFLDSHTSYFYIDHVDTKNFAAKKKVLFDVGLFNKNIKNIEDFEVKIRFKKKGYKNYFLRDLKVEHYHKDCFSSLFKRRVNQGYWATVIYFRHKKFFDKNPDEMVKSMSPLMFFAFFPWIFWFLLKEGGYNFLFEFVTGVAWRVGILGGLFSKEI